MNTHDFSYGLEMDPVSGEGYYKCVKCGSVMFEYDDPWFNLACNATSYDREKIRSRLKDQAE